MKNLKLTVSVIIGIAIATNAYATVVLDEIFDEALGNVSDTEQKYLTFDESGTSFQATILLENAGYADQNRFGIFDKATGNTLELFSGSDSVDDKVKIRFNFSMGMAWIGSEPGNKVEFGREFGFYLNSSANAGGGFFYSDSSLNTGLDLGQRHGLIFDTRYIESDSIIDAITAVVGFEDLRADYPSYDGDYNDMVVGLSNVTASSVPEPATLVLLGLGGLTLMKTKKRRAA